ncbi:MAG: amidase family protein [Oscillospiraceae bacterium]|nr:amidase family protein [Oscillospiraceae bacterium]
MKIAIDDNILIKDEICTAGSKMLYNFKSPYSATVVDKIKAAGMEIVCQSKIGEFGGETARDETKTAAYAVSNGLADTALGIDVDGAAYRSAIKNNVIYIKPTYGTVSRFGVVANVSSVDQIGVYARNFDDGFKVLEVIAGYDKNDGTTYPTEKYEYNADLVDIKSLKSIDSPDFKLNDYLASVYCIISAAEFSGNIARFDGLKFGYRTENFKSYDDIVINSRSESFTTGTKIKSLMGTYVLSEEQFEKYYLKATKIRRLIKQELDEIFKQYDVIILLPCYKAVTLANLTGCPAIIVNGKLIIAKEFDENKLFALGKSLLRGGI